MIVADGRRLTEEIPALGYRWIRGSIKRLLTEADAGAQEHEQRDQDVHKSIIAMVFQNK